MSLPFAEVIGDPVAQSKSPLIHKHWLSLLDIDADYLRTEVKPVDLRGFLQERRTDEGWRGCNVTVPHKEAVVALIDELYASAAAVGAVNCVVPREGRLVGFNTDVDGIAAALDGTELEERSAILIGAGGAARAAVAYLAGRNLEKLTVLARDPVKAESLRSLGPRIRFEFQSIEGGNPRADPAAIINASLLGMVGSAAMPAGLLAAVAARASGATVFDMVYSPLETPFLASGRAAGGKAVDGLTMLVGQAQRAFGLFFDQLPPAPDRDLRDLLTT